VHCQGCDKNCDKKCDKITYTFSNYRISGGIYSNSWVLQKKNRFDVVEELDFDIILNKPDLNT